MKHLLKNLGERLILSVILFMLIYQILNTINNKSYIGQTVYNDFNRRYSGGRWWDMSDNPLLINAANKYGKENFKIIILKNDIETLDELNKAEIFYADKFNSYTPYGYNLRMCGDNRKLLPHQIELIRKAKAKTYILRKIDTWELIEFTNLEQFCRDNNIDSSVMHNMIHKNPKLNTMVANGLYCLPERTKEEVENRYLRGSLKENILIDKNGKQHKFINVRLFAKENNLKLPSVYKLLRNQCLYHKGFRLPENVGKNKSQTGDFHLISPEGIEYKGNNITEFCKKYNLDMTSINGVIRGEKKSYKKWIKHPDFIKVKKMKRYLSCILIDDKKIKIKLDKKDFKDFCIKNNFSINSFTNFLRGTQKSLKNFKIKKVKYELF